VQVKLKEETVIYKEWPESRLDMVIVSPEDKEEGTAPRPVLLWIHGGGWKSGSPGLFLRHCRYFAARGMTACTVRYRLLPTEAGKDNGAEGEQLEAEFAATLSDCLADCRDAVRYLRAHCRELGIDPQRIAVAGDSAGGHLAVSLGTLPDKNVPGRVSSRPDMIIDCNGIMDVAQSKWRSVAGEGLAFPERTQEQGQGGQVEGQAEGEEERLAEETAAWLKRYELARQWSPLYHVAPGQPPQLLLHGLDDGTVTPEETAAYYEAQKLAGNDVEMVLLPGLRHAFILYGYSATEEQTGHVMGIIEDYLNRKGMLL
jgi:acetyl esterase